MNTFETIIKIEEAKIVIELEKITREIEDLKYLIGTGQYSLRNIDGRVERIETLTKRIRLNAYTIEKV